MSHANAQRAGSVRGANTPHRHNTPRRALRCLYAATCLISSGAILWALIRMALASPHYALVALTGALLLMLARLDILLGALEPTTSRRSATDARTGTMQ